MASKDASKCPVCKDDVQEPRGLPCEHQVCAQCLTQHVSASASADKTFQCPTCGMTCKVTDEGVIAAAPNKPSGDSASLCVKKEHGSATVFCCDCDKFFCEWCINKHQECDWMSDHTQRPVKEMSSYDIKYAQSVGQRKTCPEHELPLSIMCKTCKTVICHTCLRYKHKDHEDQELVESTTEAKKGMNSMTGEAKKVINKQNDVLKKTGQTKETIRKDVKEAKESVKKRAQKICDTVRKHEKNLLDDLDLYEEEAVNNLKFIEDNIKARKADAISLQKEISSLLQFGKPIQQVERTPVLQEKFDAQQKVEARSMKWKYVCHRKELDEELVNLMLGDVKLATSTLGQPLQQVPLKYTDDGMVTGMVVVGDCLCIVHDEDPNIWLYDTTNSQSKTCVLPDLKDPQGMALVNPTDHTVVITDQHTEGGQLHYVKIRPTDDLDITHLRSVDIALKQPRRVNVSLDNSELLIGQEGKPQFLVCDLQGNAKREVTVTSPDGTERFPYCVQQTASGYAAVMWDEDSDTIIQWLADDGTSSQTYGQNYVELIDRGLHIANSAEQLIVVDFSNDRLHLVGQNGNLVQFLLTEDDGIVSPDCVFLNKAGRLYVSHGEVGSMEVRVYKWPPKSGEYRLVLTV